ncbi:hypothetical protein DLM46_24990 [Paraburkholderia lacunae]|uniref:Uncharacterized protein n=1 Tax=Paraburkholderia lacunae TaxID=2211104 RepID=A0A370N375_9BURK|nr:hypothetical protein DLM46_24990 [Paraburkholderia lacunae]
MVGRDGRFGKRDNAGVLAHSSPGGAFSASLSVLEKRAARIGKTRAAAKSNIIPARPSRAARRRARS